MHTLLLALTVLLLFLAGCGSNSDVRIDEYMRRPVTLPDGTVIQAETNTRREDMARGMMFRDALPEGQGMLFIHGEAGKYPYWMYQVKIPLDIIWMDARGKVLELVESAAPCKGPASQCPNYGGSQTAIVVLELPGGYARKHGVAVGEIIRF